MDFANSQLIFQKGDAVELKTVIKHAPPEDLKRCTVALGLLIDSSATEATYERYARDISKPNFLKRINSLNLSKVPYQKWEKISTLLSCMKMAPSSTLLGRVQSFLLGVLRQRPAASLQPPRHNPSDGGVESKTNQELDDELWSVISANAVQSLKSLDRSVLSELKSFVTPPPVIANDVASVIGVLLNGNSTASWAEARSLLAQTKSISRLLKLNPNKIPRSDVQKLQNLLAHTTLIKDVKQLNIAASCFVEFAHAIVEYRCAPRKIPACQSFRHTRSQLSMYGALIPLD